MVLLPKEDAITPLILVLGNRASANNISILVQSMATNSQSISAAININISHTAS